MPKDGRVILVEDDDADARVIRERPPDVVDRFLGDSNCGGDAAPFKEDA